jgi:hypothetical protein
MGFLDTWKKKLKSGRSIQSSNDPPTGQPSIEMGSPSTPSGKRAKHTDHIVDFQGGDITFLYDELEPLDEFGYGIRKKLIEYITTGKGVNILNHIRHQKGTGDAMWLIGCRRGKVEGYPYMRRRHVFYHEEREWDPVFLYRMAQIYHAAANGDSQFDWHWLALFLHVVRASPDFRRYDEKHILPIHVDTVLAMLDIASEDRSVFLGLALPGLASDLGEQRPVLGTRLTGFREFAATHVDQIRHVLISGNYRHRFFMSELIVHGWIDKEPYLRDLIDEFPNEHIDMWAISKIVHIQRVLHELLIYSFQSKEDEQEYFKYGFSNNVRKLVL